MLEFGVMSCVCLDEGFWVESFPGPGMWVVLPGVMLISLFSFWVACARDVGCFGSCLCCVIRWFLYRASAPFTLFLGEVLSIFRLFWWPLAFCFYPGGLLSSGILAQNFKLSKGSWQPCEIEVFRG